jgi:hypothetical protein
MVAILFSIIVAAIAVAISMIHSPIGSLAGSGIAREEIDKAWEQPEQSRVAVQTRQFLAVVLADGKIVNPIVADHF